MYKRPSTSQPGRKSQAAGPGVPHSCSWPPRGRRRGTQAEGHARPETSCPHVSTVCARARWAVSRAPVSASSLGSFCSDVYKEEAQGRSVNGTVPSMGFGGPRSLPWPVNPAWAVL